MKYIVVYKDSGGSTHIEWAMTRECAMWIVKNCRKRGLDAKLYELHEIDSSP